MAYRNKRPINSGVALGLMLAIPAVLAWCAFVYLGTVLVCGDPEANCTSPLLALIEGFGAIAASATALGWLLNRFLRLAERLRRR
ncbi:hypothetical protein [Sphingomonas elodea]|uniref:hypothetical protein n=1 Tax=Sphingomonas elodea TaxID=179878 RepID=UPI0002631AA5|nr:hypothetical protein [Sphingomonas elodea]